MVFLTDISEIVRNFGLVIAAAIALPLAIWRSFIAHKQAKVAADNHLAETYTKAIEQIGQEKEAIQLGGLYALEKIAKTNHEYHGQIMEVLCAFVKFHAPLKTFEEIKEIKENGESVEYSNPPIIVQVAITIIGRRNADFDESPDKKNTVKIDLSWTNLTRTYLYKAHLQKANLQEAYLYEAKLQEANLIGANLIGANLYEAHLQEADLQGADLQGAKNVTLKQLQSAIINETTKLPDYINRDDLNLKKPEE